jgi:hypothetical protein
MNKSDTEKVIPNCLGRLDPTMDALRAFDVEAVLVLAAAETKRRQIKSARYIQRFENELLAIQNIAEFTANLGDIKFLERAVREAGL